MKTFEITGVGSIGDQVCVYGTLPDGTQVMDSGDEKWATRLAGALSNAVDALSLPQEAP